MGDEFRRDARASVEYYPGCDDCGKENAVLVLTSKGWLCLSCLRDYQAAGA